MPRLNAQNAIATAAEFLTRCFAPGETIALLLRREVPAATMQRIVRLETALTPRYVAWLAHENAAGTQTLPFRRNRQPPEHACCGLSRSPTYFLSELVGPSELVGWSVVMGIMWRNDALSST